MEDPAKFFVETLGGLKSVLCAAAATAVRSGSGGGSAHSAESATATPSAGEPALLSDGIVGEHHQNQRQPPKTTAADQAMQIRALPQGVNSY